MRSIVKAVLTLVLGIMIAQCGCVNVDTKPKTTPTQNNAPSKYQGDKSYYSSDRDNSEVGPGNTDWNTELTK